MRGYLSLFIITYMKWIFSVRIAAFFYIGGVQNGSLCSPIGAVVANGSVVSLRYVYRPETSSSG